MAQFIERVAVQWFEVQAGRIRVLKGHPSQLLLRDLRQLFENEKLPAITSFWVTRDKCIHFKLNFPQHLRTAVRAIVVP
ncbi:MAG: hypothetical protein EAZ65_09285 [Verrucomicrobia bacterium]|nr:MAG: hypothetical protein EAZ84_08550 [Verrucomicrobiota bacterium]TAE86644.1 MAG: hypothetical protein EAZ82_10315 [Verrucomicrobiota bacterium]TAF24423.1 MAG: hypothetical protein EAZ71_10545 [Verrucomicrobiota bacterium]TAF39984.1 MAG: hypothetical protein EAZ65_09285 [Verrucomicrobiota bacterium]